MIKFLAFLAVVIGSALAGFGILAAYKALDLKKEYRFKQHNHLVFLTAVIGIGALVYIGTWIASLVSRKADRFFTSIHINHIIPILILIIYLLYKGIYRIYFQMRTEKSADISEDNLPVQYYEKKGAFYLSPYYSTLAKVFEYSAIIVLALLSIGMGVLYLINIDRGRPIAITAETFLLLPLFLLELNAYFDGYLEEEVKKMRQKQDAPKERDTVWADLDNEYHSLWQPQLLGR